MTGSREKTDRNPDHSSDTGECESALPATNIESCKTCDATGTMQAEELTKLQDQITSLQQELKSQQEKAHVFRTKLSVPLSKLRFRMYQVRTDQPHFTVLTPRI